MKAQQKYERCKKKKKSHVNEDVIEMKQSSTARTKEEQYYANDWSIHTFQQLKGGFCYIQETITQRGEISNWCSTTITERLLLVLCGSRAGRYGLQMTRKAIFLGAFMSRDI